MITVLAFFVFSSSHDEIRYKIPPYITASTANTATYCIKRAIVFHTISYIPDSEVTHPSQPGSHQHSISGIFAAKISPTHTMIYRIEILIMERKTFIYF